MLPCQQRSAARVAVAAAAAAATVAIGQVNDIALAEAATATAAAVQKSRRLLWPRRVDEQKLDILILENYIENHFFNVTATGVVVAVEPCLLTGMTINVSTAAAAVAVVTACAQLTGSKWQHILKLDN